MRSLQETFLLCRDAAVIDRNGDHAPVAQQHYYLKLGLFAVLTFVGVKVLLPDLRVVASLMCARRLGDQPAVEVPPLPSN